jgi:hypothetical protein
MWMEGIQTFSFFFGGKNQNIKEMRDIVSSQNVIETNIVGDQTLDDIASSRDAYGENAESQSYKLFEANVALFFDNDYSLVNIKKIKIPL